jgi:lipoprotein-releasing system permease protein
MQRPAEVLSLRIATRFLRTSPAQSVLIMAGIAVGIATQVFVGSLITSLQADLVDTTVGSSPHVTITAAEEGDPVAYTDQIRSLVSGDDRVEPGAVVPVRLTSALFTEGDTNAPLSITGGELSDVDAIYSLSDRTVDGDPELGEGDIVLGVDFAEKYGLKPGDTVELVFAGNRAEELTLSAIVDLGAAAANERTAFTGPELLRDIFEWEADEYSAIQTQLQDPFDSAVVAEEWGTELSGLSVSEWQSANADLLVGLQSQSASSYMIQAFVLVAVALGIASTLAISAVQKTRQIGILKAMGLSDKRSGRIFLWQATLLGVGGTAGGVALGFALIWGFSLAPVPFSIRPEPGFIALSSAVGISVALLSSIIPIRKTSRLDPIEVIQSG